MRKPWAAAEIQSDVRIGGVVLAGGGGTIHLCYHSGSADIFDKREVMCYADGGNGILKRILPTRRALDPRLHIVRGAGTRTRNSILCVENLGVKVEDVVLAPVASAEAVLNPNQKKLGALVIDMGAGATGYAVYAEGALKHSGCLPDGGDHIRNDLSIGLRISLACAETLKIEQASVRRGQSMPGERIVLQAEPDSAGRAVEREMLNTIVRCRVREAFESVKRRLESSGVWLDSLIAGMHLTGGCSMLPGICELAEDVFGIPAPRARMKGISNVASALENPRFSCGLGLVKLAIVGNNRNHDYRQYRL